MTPLHLSLRQLQVFAAVAQGGSTAAAGTAIGLSQSATSAALNELERALDAPLFDRSGRRLLLNASGRALLPRAARGEEDQPGALRIGASTTIGNYVLPRWLGRQWKRWAEHTPAPWHSRILIDNTAGICAAVARFSLDVGLIEGPCDDPQLQARPWLRDELVVVAAPRLARQLQAAQAGAVPVTTLRRQLWLLREAGSGTRVATDLALLPQLHAWQRSLELGSSEAIKHATAEGLGLACLSEWVVADLLKSGRLVRVPTTLARMQRACYLVTHRHKQITGALQRLVGALMAS